MAYHSREIGSILQINPTHSTRYEHYYNVPLFGQYVSRFRLDLLDYGLTNLSVTLMIDGHNVVTLYNNNALSVYLNFLYPDYLVTEALYKCKNVCLRVNFQEPGCDSIFRYAPKYQISCIYTFVDNAEAKRYLRETNIPTSTANGKYFSYYDGMLWVI